jgi:hypothetical protein
MIVDYDLPVTLERVWMALADPKLLERWLMPNSVQAEVGHQFTFRTQPVPGWGRGSSVVRSWRLCLLSDCCTCGTAGRRSWMDTATNSLRL